MRPLLWDLIVVDANMRYRRGLGRILAFRVHKEDIGHALDMLRLGGAEMELHDALLRLLPSLRASDAHLPNAEQRRVLCSRLNSRYDGRLVLAILASLEQIGDEEAVPDVEKLTRFGITAQIRQAAEEVLPALRQRAGQERERLRLLRPAANPDGAATLLRPASAGEPTEERLLLRPSEGAESED